ncbi:MAG: low molecular weight phosphotyrosine protein phosphatase [Clostridiales bacterium]|nr:low molecular weight phosphotyrosine protein phosphatase [Clostridiales bacterium]
MVRIVFCCHGNICRSPLAQSVFAYLVQEAGLSDDCYIDSMATSTEEIGNPPHWGTVQKLREVGIPLVPHRARKITWRDYERFDFIIGMDEWNMDNLRRMLRGDPEEKVYKLLSFAGSRRDIADPWYTGDFDATYADVLEGCTALLEYLRGSGAL